MHVAIRTHGSFQSNHLYIWMLSIADILFPYENYKSPQDLKHNVNWAGDTYGDINWKISWVDVINEVHYLAVVKDDKRKIIKKPMENEFSNIIW